MDSVLINSVIHIVIFTVNIENAFLLYLLAVIGNPSLLCILGSHLLFNLKEAGELGLNGGTNYRPNSDFVSDIEFVEGEIHSTHPFLASIVAKVQSRTAWTADRTWTGRWQL